MLGQQGAQARKPEAMATLMRGMEKISSSVLNLILTDSSMVVDSEMAQRGATCLQRQ